MTNHKILFSIITVTRNNLNGLQKTERSIRKQTFENYEWIIIDGASNDETITYLRYTNADWVSEKDKGIYDAMNKGIEHAQGDYLIFMNAGDSFASNIALEKIKAFTPLNDLIYGDAIESGHYKTAKSYKDITYGMFTHHQAMIYRRSIVNKIRYNIDYKIAADYDFTFNIIKQCKNISYISEPLCIFKQGGISQQAVLQGRKEQFKIRQTHNINLIKNISIFTAQSALYSVRKVFPDFYWFLKRQKPDGNSKAVMLQT